MSAYSLNNEAFGSLIVYGSIALVKTSLMTLLTIRARRKNKSVVSIEDAKFYAPGRPDKQKQLIQPNDNVERVRKAHLNDLENIIPFVVLGLLYVGTNPNPTTALWHYRIFVFSRILHTIVYLNEIRQPFRALAFITGLGSFASMACRTIAAAYNFL